MRYLWRTPLLFCSLALLAAEPTPFDAARAVLATRCARCHGTDTVSGGLNVTTPTQLAQGGTHGPVLTPGKPTESRLYQHVASGKMPLGGPKLTATELAALRTWIESGAAWSGEPQLVAGAKQKRLWWAFQPVAKLPVPQVEGARTAIDAFILAKLRDKGLSFSPQADHATLIRRVHFALTGLPPQPDDLKRSYAETVDRLLASPHYGERWGRHWLDVVRYGETDGGEHNEDRPHAWRYRDYVIQALNQDKPYNHFLREQIAGDLLAPNDPQLAAATGFLTAGPWDSVSAELNKDLTLKQQARMDELDDMVTTTFHTFQGLTVNCARCHDHKFDPIPQRDYYQLTAVFAGVGFGNRPVATPEQRREYAERTKPIKDRLATTQAALDEAELPVRSRLLLAKYEAFDRERAAEPRRLPLNPLSNRNQFAPVTARRFRVVITGHAGKTPQLDTLTLLPAQLTLANWQGDREATAANPLLIELSAAAPQTVSELRWSTDRRMGRIPGMIRVYRLEASDDGRNWRTIASSLDHIGGHELDLPSLTPDELLAALTPAQRSERTRLQRELATLRAELAAVPAPATVYGAKPHALERSYLLERGSVAKPGPEVFPGALTAVPHRTALFDLPAEAPEGARRLALADWLTDERNPLTARVIVNRVWYYHFGNGIVNTPSDFGVMGDRPSHRELLDYLAAEFMANGWSLKWLHRQILQSQAYQQSSAHNAQAYASDADNRLLWRMPLRRMDAETLRDSILAVTGSLNTQMGGPSFALQKRGDRGSYIYAALDNDGPAVWRRAVYRYTVRAGERIFLDSFDCPDPSVATPQRSSSNTPVQALALLNNPFVLRQAELLAQRLQREAGSHSSAQIKRAYELLYLRTPNDRELATGQRFLAQQSLAAYCRVLFNTNEFVHIP